MNRLVWIALASAAALVMVQAQQGPVLTGTVSKAGELPVIAVPDLRAPGGREVSCRLSTRFCGMPGRFRRAQDGAQDHVSDRHSAAAGGLSPASPAPVSPHPRPGEMTAAPNGGGFWMSDWSKPPASAGYLAYGYVAEQNGVLILFGNLFDLSRDTAANAQMIGKRYLASTDDEKGARQLAHQFAADILAMFGGRAESSISFRTTTWTRSAATLAEAARSARRKSCSRPYSRRRRRWPTCGGLAATRSMRGVWFPCASGCIRSAEGSMRRMQRLGSSLRATRIRFGPRGRCDAANRARDPAEAKRVFRAHRRARSRA